MFCLSAITPKGNEYPRPLFFNSRASACFLSQRGLSPVDEVAGKVIILADKLREPCVRARAA